MVCCGSTDPAYGMEDPLMEKEAFFSGYCRSIDGSRMVAALKEGNAFLEADCCYPDCPYVQDCVVAQKITEFLQEQ